MKIRILVLRVQILTMVNKKKGKDKMWYIVKTISVQETVAVERCRRAIPYAVADKIFSPSYECKRRYLGEWHTKVKSLFPGYVFIQSENKDELERYLERIPDIVTPVMIGGAFNPIGEDERIFLGELFDSDYCISCSLGYIVDDQLIVEKGPLMGKEKYIKKIDRHRRIANIWISFMEQEKQIEVGLEVPARLTAEAYQEMKKENAASSKHIEMGA